MSSGRSVVESVTRAIVGLAPRQLLQHHVVDLAVLDDAERRHRGEELLRLVGVDVHAQSLLAAGHDQRFAEPQHGGHHRVATTAGRRGARRSASVQ